MLKQFIITCVAFASLFVFSSCRGSSQGVDSGLPTDVETTQMVREDAVQVDDVAALDSLAVERYVGVWASGATAELSIHLTFAVVEGRLAVTSCDVVGETEYNPDCELLADGTLRLLTPHEASAVPTIDATLVMQTDGAMQMAYSLTLNGGSHRAGEVILHKVVE